VTQLTAGYFASTYFPSGYWQNNYFSFYGLGLLGRIIVQMESIGYFERLGEPGLFEPGLDVIKSPFKEVINQLEKKKP
jgi:hypothetical protein